MEFSRPEDWSGYPFPSPGDLPNPEIEPRSPALQADSWPAESLGKPKKTGVGSLSLLQWIFPIQEWTGILLHCRRTLYHLSYQGNPWYFGQMKYVVMTGSIRFTKGCSYLFFKWRIVALQGCIGFCQQCRSAISTHVPLPGEPLPILHPVLPL